MKQRHESQLGCRVARAAVFSAWFAVFTLTSITSVTAADAPSPSAAASARYDTLLQSAGEQRRAGMFFLATRQYLQALELAATPEQKSFVAGEIGLILFQAKRFGDASVWLNQARHSATSPAQRARLAVDLGSLNAAQKNSAAARSFYAEGLNANEAETRASAAINLLLLDKRAGLVDKAAAIERDLALMPATAATARAGLGLRLANLALATGRAGADAAIAKIIFNNAQAALQAAETNSGPVWRRIQVAALEALAHLYEDAGKPRDSGLFTRQAIATANPQADSDLLILLEWRRARLAEAAGQLDQAIDAYQKAVAHIEAIRFDIPVVYDDGRSSFRETLEPVYLGLANLLLKKAAALGGADAAPAAQPYLAAARSVAESVKQSELQDYLGDRCTVASAQQQHINRLAPDTAVLYPVIFADRVETLVETHQGLRSIPSPITGARLRALAQDFAGGLRRGELDVNVDGAALYKILLQPAEPVLLAAGVEKVVVVPDGALRMVPYAALFDGQKFAIEKFAFSVSAALSLTQTAAPGDTRLDTLVAALSEPGPVADLLEASTHAGGFSAITASAAGAEDVQHTCGQTAQMSELGELGKAAAAAAASTRELAATGKLDALTCTLPAASANVSVSPASAPVRAAPATARFREGLILPGVLAEAQHLGENPRTTVLLNGQFTLESFSQAVETGRYNILHLASHGYFGGSGDGSYLLAHDKLITMGALQGLLRSEKLTGKPIELLTLSACETADGDDRAPLGISGAALKARAKSALGTLWPVADDAAQQLMVAFYRNLLQGQTKTAALRSAQLQLLKTPKTSNPFFWAPFTLVGNWL